MKKIIRSRIFYFVLGALIFGSIGVYAATLLASDIPYTNNEQETVQSAIDDLYDKSKNYCPNNKTCINKENAKGLLPICKRATTLHQETCVVNDSNNPTWYCSGEGYTRNGSKGTTTITYGQLGTNGVLTAGDAFDCDINLDGTYDANTERFYYVSQLYTGGVPGSLNWNENVAVLIYYNNVSGGLPNNKSAYAYDSSRENWHGPQTAITQLPTTEQWYNINLTNVERTIRNRIGGNTTGGGTLPNLFNYSGKSARLLTYQEAIKGCPTGATTLTGCNYLIENTHYSNLGYKFGYWLETPSDFDLEIGTYIAGHARVFSTNYVDENNLFGVRPAIEVSINDIEY